MRVSTPMENSRHFPATNPPIVAENGFIWIILVVILPIIFTLVLCVIAALLYRYQRGQTRRNQNYSSTASIDRYHPTIATIFPVPPRNFFVLEDLPPPYESISERKPPLSSIEANHQ